MLYVTEDGEKITVESRPCPLCGFDDILILKDRPGEWVGNGWELEEIWTIQCPGCFMVRMDLPANHFMANKYYETVQEAVMQWNSECDKYSKRGKEVDVNDAHG